MLFRYAVQVSPTLRARLAFGIFQAYEALQRARFKLELKMRWKPRVALFRHAMQAPPTRQTF